MSCSIIKNTLGRTGIRVAKLGFGAAPLGQKFYDLKGDPKATVASALSHGINYFDTSPYYGASEEALGKALQGYPRDSFVVSTKVGRLAEDKFDYSPAWIEKSVEKSLKLLGLSHIDILLLHDVEFLPDTSSINEVSLPALQKLKERGVVRAIGFSCYPLETFPQILDGPNGELVDVVLSYAHNNLVNATLPCLDIYLQGKGVGLIDASPLALGLLRDDPPPEWHKAPPELRSECREIAENLRKTGWTPLQEIALKFSLRSTPASTLLVGMSSPEEVERNVATFGRASSYAEFELAQLIRDKLRHWCFTSLA